MEGVADMIGEIQVEGTFPTARSWSPYTTLSGKAEGRGRGQGQGQRSGSEARGQRVR
jgi:hypothetical protein